METELVKKVLPRDIYNHRYIVLLPFANFSATSLTYLYITCTYLFALHANFPFWPPTVCLHQCYINALLSLCKKQLLTLASCEKTLFRGDGDSPVYKPSKASD